GRGPVNGCTTWSIGCTHCTRQPGGRWHRISRRMNIKSAAGLLLASVLMTCAGCAPSPAPVRGAEKYDRAFDAAVGAAKEVGVEVSSADRAAGRISGTKAGAEVSIWLQWQPSGSTKVE